MSRGVDGAEMRSTTTEQARALRISEGMAVRTALAIIGQLSDAWQLYLYSPAHRSPSAMDEDALVRMEAARKLYDAGKADLAQRRGAHGTEYLIQRR